MATSPVGITIVAGEASGDLHGARLVEALRRREPHLSFTGMGGAGMRAAGVRLLADAGETAVVGIAELWEKRRALRAALLPLRGPMPFVPRAGRCARRPCAACSRRSLPGTTASITG